MGDRAPTAAIELRLSQPQQLFNSLDPSPFHERDLDDDAEQYIVDSADEYPLDQPLTLVLYLPSEASTGKPPDLASGIHHYFAYRAEETRRRLRIFFREGRIALVVGVTFLFICIALRQLVLMATRGLVAQIADEGLYIVGWVAMWRPLEIFLYDWRPIRRRQRLFAKLADIPIVIRAS
ncbi:MAG TPA: hypothetical protein VL948_25440 [Verrucomicrobiae bacterium]|jgi:hypothetical protein|nr:hypothetical protein [Verrucomicrobiae bacterium]